MNNLKRTIAAGLALCMLLISLSALISCSENSNNEPNGKEDASVQTEATDSAGSENLTDQERRQLIPDNLSEADYKGREFRFCIESRKEFEIWSSELNGEITNDVVYNRNMLIEDRFNVKITAAVMSETQNLVNTHVAADDDAFEVYGIRSYVSYVPIVSHSVVNWYDVPNMTFDSPWYNKLTNDAATFNGILYNLTCSLGITQMQYTYGMFFNQRVVEDFGHTPASLYQLVYDGQWVYDKFYEIVSDIYVDVNGDSKKDIDDIYGFACEGWNSNDVWLSAFNQPISGKDADGNVTMKIISEKSTEALVKIYDLAYNTQSTYMYPTDTYEKYFASSKLAISAMPFRVAYSELRDMEDSYGILPYPKWDENQEKYLTSIHDQYSVFVVPKTISDTTFLGTIMQALCAETYKTVYPAFYDVALKSKYTDDIDTAAMVDIVMEGANMDFAFMFGETVFQRTPYFFRDLIVAKSTDLLSKYKSIEKVLLKSLEKLSTYY